MMRDFRVLVYENPYISTTAGANKNRGSLMAMPRPDQVSGLSFSTALPGGFVECRFTFKGTTIEVARWRAQMAAQHLEVLEGGDRPEGFYGIIDDFDKDEVNNQLGIVARGYYSTLDDQRYTATYAGSAQFQTAVLTALSNNSLSKNYRGYFLEGTAGRVENSGTVVPYVYGSGEQETTREAIEHWASLGDSSGNRYWPAVWDSRFLEAHPEGTSTTWRVRVAQLSECTLSSSRRNVFNDIVVSYQDSADGTRKKTVSQADTTSQQRYGIRQMLYVAGDLDLTGATQLATQLLARLKDLHDEPSIALGGSVLDASLVERPSWRVRAGDILECIDLTLPDLPVGQIVRGRNQWLIRETSYDAESDTMQLVLDVESPTVENVVKSVVRSLRVASAGQNGTNIDSTLGRIETVLIDPSAGGTAYIGGSALTAGVMTEGFRANGNGFRVMGRELILPQVASALPPPSGTTSIRSDTSGTIYVWPDGGSETALGSGGGGPSAAVVLTEQATLHSLSAAGTQEIQAKTDHNAYLIDQLGHQRRLCGAPLLDSNGNILVDSGGNVVTEW